MYRIINKIHEIWLKNNYFSKEKYGKLNIFYKKFFELDIIKSSQALAFISFFSIVPIYAFFFFVLAALSEKDAEKLTAFVGQYVFPEYIDALTIFLDNLSSQIIKIGAIGLPFLMLTAILAYSQIEKVINIIWDSHERRKWYQNAYIMLNIVILGPFIVVFLFSLTPYLNRVNILGNISPFFQVLTPYLISYVILLGILFAVYLYLPVVYVKKKPVLKAAAIVALLIQIANYAIGIYISNFARFNVFYGILAIAPVILIWFFVIWSIIISGSLYAHLEQNYFYGQETTYQNSSLSLINQTLQVLVLIMHRFETGKVALSFQEIQYSTGVSVERLKFIRDYLQNKQYIYAISSTNLKGGKSLSFQMNKSPSSIRVQDIVQDIHSPAIIALPGGVSKFLRESSLHPLFYSDINLRQIYYLSDQVMNAYNKNLFKQIEKQITQEEEAKKEAK